MAVENASGSCRKISDKSDDTLMKGVRTEGALGHDIRDLVLNLRNFTSKPFFEI